MRFPDNMKLDELYLQMFSWIDTVKFEMQLIEFLSRTIFRKKFIDLGVVFESIDKRRLKMSRKRSIKDLECHSSKIFVFKKLCNRIILLIFIYICL